VRLAQLEDASATRSADARRAGLAKKDHVHALHRLASLVALVLLVAACGADGEAPAGAPAMPGTAVETAGAAAEPSAPASSREPLSAPSAPSVPPADPAAVAAVRTLIDSARLDDPETLDALGAARFDDGAPEAAAAALAEGTTGDARWAAVWTYASSGTDAAVLRPVLDDPDPTLRALAAAALTAWGDPAGIPVLAALVEQPDRLAGSYPPTSVGEFAAGTLARFVSGPAIAPGSEPADEGAAWAAWTARHDPSTLAFDPETGTWSVP
jgi:hypothetical protein